MIFTNVFDSSMLLGASPATFFSSEVTHPGRLGVPWLSSLVCSVQGHALVLPRIHSFLATLLQDPLQGH